MKDTEEIDGTESRYDSRDIIARRDYLKDERDGLEEAQNDAEEAARVAESEWRESGEEDEEDAKDAWDTACEERDDAQKAAADWYAEYGEEFAALDAACEEGEGYGDWSHGETLISEDSFTEYARELAEDIGAIDRNAAWPLRHIDWDAAADELKTDYMEITLFGKTFLMRA